MKKTITTVCLLLVLVASGCAPASTTLPTTPGQSASATAQATYVKITPEAAKARIDSGDDLIILDVRSEAEYQEKHIPDAILLPVDQLQTLAAEVLPDQDAEILVYCRSGNRSKQAAQGLLKMGYTQVYDFGGIGSWPYETVASH